MVVVKELVTNSLTGITAIMSLKKLQGKLLLSMTRTIKISRVLAERFL